jgi:hypothetical protein
LTNCKTAQQDIGCPCEFVGQELPLLLVHATKSYSAFLTPSNRVATFPAMRLSCA